MNFLPRRTRERMVALVVVALVLFNYPVVMLFGAERLVLGVPLLYLFFFGAWLVFIVLIALLMEFGGADTEQDREEGGGA